LTTSVDPIRPTPILPGPPKRLWEGLPAPYLLSFFFVAIATGFGFLIEELTGRFSTFPFYAAVVASVWFGTGPGVFAVVLSIVTVEDIWTPPLFSLRIDSTELPSFVAFVVATLMTFAWSYQRRTAHRVLEATVAQRTADLRQTNQALQIEIAERQAAEDELRRSEALLAQGEKLSRTASWILLHPGDEVRWSAELFEILALDPAEPPSYALLYDRIHHSDQARFAAVTERALQEGGEFSCEMRIVTPGGVTKFVQAVGTVKRGAAGVGTAGVTECIGTIMDLTERKKTEQALHDAEAELARTLRLATLAEVAATIAHEINQPLAAIAANGSACLRSLTRSPPLMGTAREAAECIVSDSHRAANVIARIRALFDKEEPQREDVDINVLLREVIGLSRSAIDRLRVVVRTKLSNSLPTLMADPVQLRQVLVNLVTNALEAMEEAGGRPRQLTLCSKADGNAITVAVEDTGVGLQPGQAERVFDSFYTTKRKGIGVGLAISRSIVEAHGGSIWAVPNEPRGARFGLTLPLVAATDEPLEMAPASKE
jgi:signal transduction histidine kinase